MDMEITSKKLLPRLGRRSGQNNAQDELKFDDDLDSPTSVMSGRSTAVGRPPVAPPRTRKTGWSDDLKSAKMRGNMNIIEQERSRAADRDIEADDIPVIPDMDEIQEDSSLSDITANPALNMNRVTAYKELDTDLVKNAAFTALGDINLSLLAEKLYNEEMVKESDDVWNWSILFTQVTSEINSETQKKVIA